MWTAPLQFLLRYWLPLLTVTLSGLLWIQTNRLGNEQEAHRVTKADFKARSDMAIAAEDQQKKEYDDALNSAAKRTQTLVEQAKSEAWRNFTARYGPLSKPLGSTTGSVGNIGLCKLPASTATDTSETVSPSVVDGVAQEFVVNCATDAARLAGWQSWARELNLPVKE